MKRDIINSDAGTVGRSQDSPRPRAVYDHPPCCLPDQLVLLYLQLLTSSSEGQETGKYFLHQCFVNWYRPSPILFLHVHILSGNPILPTSSSLTSGLWRRKTIIRFYKCIFFKYEMTGFLRLGENNTLSTNRIELSKMGGEHSED